MVFSSRNTFRGLMTPPPSTVKRWVPLADMNAVRCHPVFAAIYNQLPEGVRERLSVRLRMDPYFIAATAVFVTEDGREFETRLQPTTLSDGRVAAVLIPEAFIAYLCLVA
jgi:hypothetical protein